MGKNDLWIAAMASVQEAIVLTTDQDFDHLTPTFDRCAAAEGLQAALTPHFVPMRPNWAHVKSTDSDDQK